MVDVVIEEQVDTDEGWEFTVKIGERSYLVTLSETYYERLTAGELRPAELIELAFDFLLARESEESILRQFDLREIERYFPEFAEEVSRNL